VQISYQFSACWLTVHSHYLSSQRSDDWWYYMEVELHVYYSICTLLRLFPLCLQQIVIQALQL
jgi:hypothetical protein